MERKEEQPIKGITVRQVDPFEISLFLWKDQIVEFLQRPQFDNSAIINISLLLNSPEKALKTGFSHMAVVKERNGGTSRQSVLETKE